MSQTFKVKETSKNRLPSYYDWSALVWHKCCNTLVHISNHQRAPLHSQFHQHCHKRTVTSNWYYLTPHSFYLGMNKNWDRIQQQIKKSTRNRRGPNFCFSKSQECSRQHWYIYKYHCNRNIDWIQPNRIGVYYIKLTCSITETKWKSVDFVQTLPNVVFNQGNWTIPLASGTSHAFISLSLMPWIS